jgi:hypothetical protein
MNANNDIASSSLVDSKKSTYIVRRRAHLFLLMFFSFSSYILLPLPFYLQCSRATLPIFVPKFATLLYVNDSDCSNLQYGGLFICYFKIVMTLHMLFAEVKASL